MSRNYNYLSSSRDAWLKKDVGEDDCSSRSKWQVMRTWLALLFFVLAFNGHSVFAQATIQIGSGTGTSSAMPVSTCWGYSYSQQIVLASEYANGSGGPGNITKIRYHAEELIQPVDVWTGWTIYLGHTAKTSFSSGTDFVPLTELTQVFSGTITPIEENWFEITFTTPFN